MKRWLVVLGLLLWLSWSALAQAADAPAPPAKDPAAKPAPSKGEATAFLAAGYQGLFLDTQPFNKKLAPLDVQDFAFPLGGVLTFGVDLGVRPHYVGIATSPTFLVLETHRGGRYGQLALTYSDVSLYYRLRAHDYVGLHADAGFAFGHWQFIALGRRTKGDSFNGQASGDRFGIIPKAGLIVYLDDKAHSGFDFYGGYQANFWRGAELYSGDMRRKKFEDFNFSHGFAGIQYRMNFH